MHELSLCRDIVDVAVEELGRMRPAPRRVLKVRVVAGVLRQVVPEFMQDAFRFLVADTPLAGAGLDIRIRPMRVRCSECGCENEAMDIPLGCPSCGSAQISIEGGSELSLESMEVED